MPSERRTVEVWADWESLGGPARVGQLHATFARGKELFSFEYDEAWLDTAGQSSLDPALRLGPGRQFAAAGRENFGVFLDSAPDRWGRVLMQRREAQLAREGGRNERRLQELDYLLGVYDGHRLGGLRFRVAGGAFLDDDATLASPPWTSLKDLQHASLLLERDKDASDARYGKWIRLLIAPGRSLGGARPKASVLDEQGRLWIAKFPSDRDGHDVGAWEGVAASLAKRAGVLTADSRCGRFAGRHHTFLARRFDRTGSGARLHFCSAMTLLERSDGEAGASYLDLAQVIVQHGSQPASDLEQLWRRIVFFICISNGDDHLRNHGFLLEPKGWSLAPAYDMNPIALADGLTLNISETDNALSLDLARDVAKYFRLGARRAESIIAEVIHAVQDWRKEAQAAGIARAEQNEMASAFDSAS